MKSPRSVPWTNRQRVLLAIYARAEKDGMRCYATWAEIAADAGIRPETAKWHAQGLEREGIIRTAPIADRRPRRTLVLMDHPGAWDYLDSLTGTIAGSKLPMTDCQGVKDASYHGSKGQGRSVR